MENITSKVNDQLEKLIRFNQEYPEENSFQKDNRTSSIIIVNPTETAVNGKYFHKNGFLDNEKNIDSSLNYHHEYTNETKRENWSNDIEFLLSCIAISVGLGNVWRFPFAALENGGGAFVIPYIIVLLLIGRPVYYMEVIIGQFSSQGCIKAYSFAPVMRGAGFGQVYATAMATTYYACVMALTIRYLVASVSEILPWAFCREEWGNSCFDSASKDDNLLISNRSDVSVTKRASAEYYFETVILREKDSIEDGLGPPNLDLVICLGAAWFIIGTILIKGIRSSGKASYFLAVFPYIIMIVLLIRSVTLPGSMDGILYFLKPQWDQLLNPKVWYAAITQVFFSLAICFGTLIMYASYNKFSKNVYRDVIIITTVDSLTSILAGCIIFGILGNLAYETKATEISKVVKGGVGLAFISYPDAIAKFEYMPQVFAVLFFLMLLVLGIGSNIGMASCVITSVKDRFNHLPHWFLSASISIIGFLLGLVYMTPGGQYVLNLIDFFGTSFIGLVLAIVELIAVSWIYGVKRLCQDIEFMLGIKTGFYWRICWGFITPGLMAIVLIYTLIEYQPLRYKDEMYPDLAYIIGWTISCIGISFFPILGIHWIYKQPESTIYEKIKSACRPGSNWGPLDPKTNEEYQKFRLNIDHNEVSKELNLWGRILDNVFG